MRRISAEVILLILAFVCFPMVVGTGLVGALSGDHTPWSVAFEWFSPVQAELKLGGGAVFVAFSLLLLYSSYFGLRRFKKEATPSFDLPLALSGFGAIFAWASRTPLLSLIGLFLTVFAGCTFLSRWGKRSRADRDLLIPFGLSGFMSILAVAIGVSWGSEHEALVCLFIAGVLISRVYPFHAWVFDDSKSVSPERALILGYLPLLAFLGSISGMHASVEVRGAVSPILWVGAAVILIHQLSAMAGSGVQRVLEAGHSCALLFSVFIALWVGSFPALIFAITVGTGTWVMGQWAVMQGSKPEGVHIALLAICALSILGFPLFTSHQAIAHVIHELLPYPLILIPMGVSSGIALLHLPAVFGRTVTAGATKKQKKVVGVFWLVPPILPLFSLLALGVFFGGWKDLETGRWFEPLDLLFKDPQLTLMLNEQSAGLGGYFGWLVLILAIGWVFSNIERSERLRVRMERFPGGSRLAGAVFPAFQRVLERLDSTVSETSWERWIERPLVRAALSSSRGIAQATQLSDHFFTRIGHAVIKKLDVIARELQNGDIQRYLLFSIFASVLMALLLLGMR
jgi:hypothetical protein